MKKHVLLAIIAAIFAATGNTHAEQPTSYARNIAFAIDHTQVGGSDLTNFNIVVRGTFPDLRSVANGGLIQNVPGPPADFVVSPNQDGSSKYDFEIADYDETTGYIEVYFRRPMVSASVDGTFYFAYDDPTVTTYQGSPLGAKSEWDANYKAVYHFANGWPSESTNTHAEGNVSGATLTTGVVGDALNFAGGSNVVDVPLPASGFAFPNYARPMTFEFWLQLPSGCGPAATILQASSHSDFLIYVRPDFDSRGFATVDLFTASGEAGIPCPTDGAWHHYMFAVNESGGLVVTFDGVQQSLLTMFGGAVSPNTSTAVMFGNGLRPLVGKLDEVRFSNVARPANWGTAAYNNQKVGATFVVNTAATPPTITTQPASQTITSGQTTTLSVAATGTAPLAYQWYVGPSGTTTTPIAGATTSSYTTPALTTTTDYWVRVSNAGGPVNSATATVTVQPVNVAPSFVKGPDQTVGQSAGLQTVVNWATSISPTQGVSFLVSNNNNGLFTVQPAVASNGTLTYQPNASATGGATVTVQAVDAAGMSAPQTFFIQVTGLVVTTATFVTTNTTTQGNWIPTPNFSSTLGAFGEDGYVLAGGASSLPYYVANVSVVGDTGSPIVWAEHITDDSRALERPLAPTDRFAAGWYQVGNAPSAGSFSLDVNLIDDSLSHQVALYLLDWNQSGFAERLEVLNADTQEVLDTRTVSNFGGGKYVAWNIRGHVTIRVTSTNPDVPVAVVSGIFLDAVHVPAAATFLKTDTTTQGSWIGVYGSESYALAGEATSIQLRTHISVLDSAGVIPWVEHTNDLPGLQRPPPDTDRFATAWHQVGNFPPGPPTPSPGSFSLYLNHTNGHMGQLAIYVLDWNQFGLTERIDVIDSDTQTVLDTQNVSNFGSGQYLVWHVKGRIILRVTSTNPNVPAPVVSAIFIDPPAAGSSSAPTITTQPASQTIASGQTATLSVAATGTAPLTYQWYVGPSGTTTTPIAGATTSSYTTPALTTTTDYWVRVSNAGGPANSATATITVPSAPTITTQPASQTIASGQTATLSVAATGTAPLTYQWYVGSSGTTTSPITGATASSYTTPALTTTTSYWVRVSNAGGPANSATATITVPSAPTITTQPASQTIASGQTATLSVAATGTAPLTYQWYVGPSGTTTTPIAGATTSSYTTPALTTTTDYWVRVSNAGGPANSATATITVPSAPTITTQPASQTIASGQTATLSVAATGTAPLTYQWYVGSSGTTTSPIAGATASSYTTPALTTTTSYWVRVSNAGGSANSATATITVPSAPTITTQPASQTIASGQTATLSVAATGTAPLTYQWYVGSSGTTTSPITGATASSYTTPALTSTTSYWVRVSNAGGTANSATAKITVTKRPK